MPPLTLERKQVAFDEFALGTEGTGTFTGRASVFGQVDSYGDTVVPGAYAETLPKFLADGFVAWAHDDRIPVAYPTRAWEAADGLWIEAAFHSTPEAQSARQIAMERHAAGKRTGLSIGYYAKRAEMAEDGVRRLLAVDLVEVSLVMSPADDYARVSAVKAVDEGATDAPATPSADRKASCHCADPEAWLDYETHAAQIQDFIERTRQGAAKRIKEGRAISTARRDRMASVSGELRKAADEIDAMLAETAPPERASSYDARLAIALRAARLRHRGVLLESAPCP